MDEDQPSVPGMRTVSLNSPEAYEALCRRRDEPWIRNGALPRTPRAWEQSAPDDADVETTREWLTHVEAGRLG